MAFKIHSVFVYIALCLLSLYHADAFILGKVIKGQPSIVGFSWKNCGAATDSIQIKSLDISPTTIKVPGNTTAGGSFSFASATPTDIGISLTMERKVAGFWIKVPCIDNVGSCTYGDLCKDWADACPKYFSKAGIPCTCPIPANTYVIADAVYDIKGKIPSAANGDYRVTGNLVSGTAGHLGCIEIEVNVSN